MNRRLELLDSVSERWSACQRCELSLTRSRVVQWRGNPEARLFIVGEAPGAEEDARGIPFVGRAGELLDRLLQEAGIRPTEDVFVTNMVACRPPGNRAPETAELAACAPRLHSLIRTVKPKVLLLLGSTALRLVGYGKISALRGEEMTAELWCENGEVKIWPAIPTYHPSYVLRAGSHNSETYKIVLGDVKKAWKLSKS